MRHQGDNRQQFTVLKFSYHERYNRQEILDALETSAEIIWSVRNLPKSSIKVAMSTKLTIHNPQQITVLNVAYIFEEEIIMKYSVASRLALTLDDMPLQEMITVRLITVMLVLSK